MDELKKDYPWTKAPLIACAPMRLVAYAPLAVSVSQAGGLGFIGAGNDTSNLAELMQEARKLLSDSPPSSSVRTNTQTLPVGLGFLLWGASLSAVTTLLSNPETRPSAIWLFAPRSPSDLGTWTSAIRSATDSATKVWIQVGTVTEAIHAAETCSPDVLVIQGQDAGGHGLTKGASLIPLLPECIDAVTSTCRDKGLRVPVFVATGAVTTGSQVAAALTLGAAGIVAGTRFLAAREANIAKGYQNAVLRAKDGGLTTVRSHVYDTLRGTTDWPAQYGGRGVVNDSYVDAVEKGLAMEENKRLYDAALQRGDEGWNEDGGRLTTYAGTGVGLVKKVMGADEIVRELREEGVEILERTARSWANAT